MRKQLFINNNIIWQKGIKNRAAVRPVFKIIYDNPGLFKSSAYLISLISSLCQRPVFFIALCAVSLSLLVELLCPFLIAEL